MNGRFVLEAEASLDVLPLLHAAARSFTRNAGAPGEIAEQLALAVEELASNAVLYAYPRRRSPGPLRLSGTWRGGRIVLRVLHRGRPWTGDQLPDKNCCIEPGRTGGMGLVIAQRAADDLRAVRSGGWRGFRLVRSFTPCAGPAP